MTKRRSIADWLLAKGFPPLSEEQYQDNIRALVPTVCFCEETAMTTDLSNKSVEDLIAEFAFTAEGETYQFNAIRLDAFDELARRLEEAQQRNAAHDAKVAAESKAEALKDAAHWFLYNWLGPLEEDWYDLNKPVKILEKMAAEYQTKAAEAGRKE